MRLFHLEVTLVSIPSLCNECLSNNWSSCRHSCRRWPGLAPNFAQHSKCAEGACLKSSKKC